MSPWAASQLRVASLPLGKHFFKCKFKIRSDRFHPQCWSGPLQLLWGAGGYNEPPLCKEQTWTGSQAELLAGENAQSLSSCIRNQGSDGGELMEIIDTMHFYFYSNYTPKCSNLENGFSS